MTSLKSLNIVPLPKSGGNPILDRRARVIARLEEQKLLLNDSTYMRSIRSWSKGDDGKKALVETKQRILPWWTAQPSGSYVFFISLRLEADRIREGQSCHSCAFIGKAAFSNRYANCGSSKW
jgi:hypothetical protein